MNELLVAYLIWHAVGMLCFLFACWCISPAILVKDVLMSLVAGIMGPFNLFGCLYAEGELLNRVVWRGHFRKDDQ